MFKESEIAHWLFRSKSPKKQTADHCVEGDRWETVVQCLGPTPALIRAWHLYQKVPIELRQIFRIGSHTGADDCCETGLRSLIGCCHGNHFFIQSTEFFHHSDQCVINFVHSATTRLTVVDVIHVVDRRGVLLTTPIHWRLAVACHRKWINAFSVHRIGFACDWIRQEVQVLRWMQAYQLTDQLTIINKWRGG